LKILFKRIIFLGEEFLLLETFLYYVDPMLHLLRRKKMLYEIVFKLREV